MYVIAWQSLMEEVKQSHGRIKSVGDHYVVNIQT